ncbi:MAG TPA: DNA mismatch repair protein MutS [Tissierellales bacterium]|nr:DNA mismatch repair protein MutS [Tissierellales bacterium]
MTPMMKQYMEIKSNYKDSILFFRLGDFYEMFFDDALIASRELEITLTQRGIGQDKKAPMCGVPYHAVEPYIAKLIDKGYKVAICEQLESPSEAKGIVKRDVIQVVTPGTITDMNALDEKSNNFLACIYHDEYGAGISYVDNSTGELYTTELLGNGQSTLNFVLDEIGKIQPSEIILNNKLRRKNKIIKIIQNNINSYINEYDNQLINIKFCKDIIENNFDDNVFEKSGINRKKYSVLATGILLNYLKETQKIALTHINEVIYYNLDNYMELDINTRINLEINETIMGKGKKGSLIWLLDKTSTAMGGRLLKNWLEQPLIEKELIEERLDIVEIFSKDVILTSEIKEYLKNIYDLERLMGKITYGNCNARDLISLKSSLEELPKIKKLIIDSGYAPLNKLADKIDTLDDVFNLIDNSIVDEPPISIKEGGIIKGDFNEELRSLKSISKNGKEWLSNLEQEEKKKTGIKSLKIGYNKLFGYFIEVTKSNLELVPDEYIRKQTLVNSERYITPKLKDMESTILGSEEKMIDLEYKIFVNIRDRIKKETARIQKVSKIISKIDALNSLGYVAYTNNYVRPSLNNDGFIDIKEGRHPVVEKTLEEELFVPNDTVLDNKDSRCLIITGPNMAGKSTYMRQVALITLMAQVGSFVPAKEASVGLVDRIFTRIGASDNLSQGESTFMVEMNEVSNIISNATKDSLIILDEVGRGTSTYDGLSIAWAVVEYIAENIKARTLFATHYHELTELENRLPGIKNYNILIEEQGDEIIFLRKIVEGSTNKSYGVEVAKLAGINQSIIMRANEILKSIEFSHKENQNIEIKDSSNENTQLNLTDYKKDNLIEKIKYIDTVKMTPIEALNILHKLVEEAKEL